MNDDLHHLAAAYVVDALDSDERAAFERHYPTCEICTREVQEFRATAAELAGGVADDPPAHVRDAVLDEINSTRQLPPEVGGERRLDPSDELAARRTRRRLPMMGAVAAIAIVVVGAVFLLGSTEDGIDDLLAAPDALVTELEGDGGAIRVVWSPERDEVAVFGTDLDEPDSGLRYALWFILPDGVRAAGLFDAPEGSARALLTVADVEAVGWGITIEPETGSDQPTTDVIFAGTI